MLVLLSAVSRGTFASTSTRYKRRLCVCSLMTENRSDTMEDSFPLELNAQYHAEITEKIFASTSGYLSSGKSGPPVLLEPQQT